MARLLQFGILASLLGAAAASAVEPGRKRIAFAVVTPLAFLLLFGLYRAIRNLLAFPSDPYGPLPLNRERYQAYLERTAKHDRALVERWRLQARIRSALQKAREASDLARARRHLAEALERFEAWKEGAAAPRRERRALVRRFEADCRELASSIYIHAAKARLEHGRGLKTERGRLRAREQALAILREGLEDAQASREVLEGFARAAGLELGEDAAAQSAEEPELFAQGASTPAGASDPQPGFEPGEPLSASRALEFWRTVQEAPERTPVRRAREDFERLFALRYRHAFGEGHCFGSEEECRVQLDGLVEQCCEELAAYSRLLGRSGPSRPDLRALASLPADLLAWHDEPELEALRGLLRSEEGWIGVGDLARLWPLRGKGGGLPRTHCTRYAALIGKLGFGVEPDPRFGGPPWPAGGEVRVFPLASDAPRVPSRAYEAAALVVHIAVAVSAAEGEGEGDLLGAAEEKALRNHLESGLDLPSAERRRLEMHLDWMRRHPPRLGGLRRRVERLGEGQRERLADFLLRVACADGRVTPGEMRFLERTYGLLGRDPAAVHRDLHRYSAGGTSPAPGGGGIGLDPARLAQKIEETRRVSRLLGDVFAEETGGEESPEPSLPGVSGEEPSYAGLDVAHSRLLATLATQEQWPRIELEELAEELGLLLDGALDTLNDIAFESEDAPLWEGDDPLWLDRDLATRLMGENPAG